ncbi:metal-dependent hydrolase [Bacillus bombysepticus]|uniref:metal-dependent hydrolase n=1 Tax=Bacillus bombysepticus TaxID=658666 RepID=UPI00301A8901
MRYNTHMVSSLTMGVGLTMVTDIPLSIGFAAGVLIGSLLPDIDEPKSFIGKRSFGISKLVNWMFGHRGFTHSLFAVLPLFLIYLFIKNPEVVVSWFGANIRTEFFRDLVQNIAVPAIVNFWLGISFGYLFHLVGDFFSKSGIPLFLPITKKRYKIPIYVTGKKSEQVVFVICSILLVVLSLFKIGIF